MHRRLHRTSPPLPLKLFVLSAKRTHNYGRVVAYSGNGTNTTGKNPDIPIFISSVSNQTLLNSQASCSGPVTSNPSKFWREQVNHNGASPFNSDSTYKVWRNVKDYGAVGDGSTDDSGAFNFAITGNVSDQLDLST